MKNICSVFPGIFFSIEKMENKPAPNSIDHWIDPFNRSFPRSLTSQKFKESHGPDFSRKNNNTVSFVEHQEVQPPKGIFKDLGAQGYKDEEFLIKWIYQDFC